MMYNNIGDIMTKKQAEAKIIAVIDKLRPFLINDGGNIEFVKYEDNMVYIRLGGACANCSLIDMTLKEGVEMAIQEEVPEVKAVINLPPNVEIIN